MSFGAEFKQMRQQGGAPKITPEVAKEAETAAAAKAAEAPTVDDPDQETFAQPFVDGQTLGEAAEATPGEAPVVPPPSPEAKKVPIKINGKTFDSVEDATEYAANLERELEKQEAYTKGLKESSQPPAEVKKQEVKKIKLIADKFFENPDVALEELEQHVIEMSERRMILREQEKDQAQKQVENAKKTWDGFYQSNADLADWQEEVNLVTKRDWERLQHLPVEEGLKEIARLSRAYVASVKERALPKQSLPSKSAQTASQGGKATTATQEPATEKKISFAQQVRSTNKRTAMQSES